MKWKGLTATFALAISLLAAPAAAQSTCSRELLQSLGDKYIQAQTEGMALRIPMGNWVNYNENFAMSSMTYGGVLASPQVIDWHRAMYDTTACSILVQVIITNPEHPYVLATMLNVRGDGVNSFDVIVAEEHDWLFDAARTLYYAKREDWGEIPEARRNTRAELKAAADAYLDLFSDKSVNVPWGTPCARLEGSAYTGKGQPDDSCNLGVPEGIEMADRRYVIDEALGTVGVLLKMGPSKRPDAHIFRIEDGKIRFIHTVTNCGDQENCGFRPFREMVAENPGIHPDLGE